VLATIVSVKKERKEKENGRVIGITRQTCVMIHFVVSVHQGKKNRRAAI
jgi:hypothetical protein